MGLSLVSAGSGWSVAMMCGLLAAVAARVAEPQPQGERAQ